jgi:hypothetical protein
VKIGAENIERGHRTLTEENREKTAMVRDQVLLAA